jgi:hypothetical protein
MSTSNNLNLLPTEIIYNIISKLDIKDFNNFIKINKYFNSYKNEFNKNIYYNIDYLKYFNFNNKIDYKFFLNNNNINGILNYTLQLGNLEILKYLHENGVNITPQYNYKIKFDSDKYFGYLQFINYLHKLCCFDNKFYNYDTVSKNVYIEIFRDLHEDNSFNTIIPKKFTGIFGDDNEPEYINMSYNVYLKVSSYLNESGYDFYLYSNYFISI